MDDRDIMGNDEERFGPRYTSFDNGFIKDMAEKGTHIFDNTDLSDDPDRPDLIEHGGFNNTKDIEERIRDIISRKRVLTDLLISIQEQMLDLSKRARELEKDYVPGRGYPTDLNYEKLEKEYYELVIEEQKMRNEWDTLDNELDQLQVALKRRRQYNRDTFKTDVKARRSLQQQLENAKIELSRLKSTRNLNGLDEEFVSLRINELEEIIKDLEKQIKDFNVNLYPSAVNPEKRGIRHVYFEEKNGKEYDGKSYKTVKVLDGDLVTPPSENPVLDEEHEFDCWTLNGEPFDFNTPITKNTTLSAKYKVKENIIEDELEDTCKVKFIIGDSVINEEVIPKGTTVSKPENIRLKKGKIKNWVGPDGQEFDFSTPINEDTVITANVKRFNIDWKKTAAIAAGIGLAVITSAVDATMLFPVTSVAMAVAMGGSWFITNSKLKNLQPPIPEEEIATLTGVKKASANVKNFFRNPENMQYLKSFFRTATFSTTFASAKGIAGFVSGKMNGVGNTSGDSIDNGNSVTQGNSGEGSLQDLYDPNNPGEVFTTSEGALNNVGGVSPHLDSFASSSPAQLFNSSTGEFINLSPEELAGPIEGLAKYGDIDKLAINVLGEGGTPIGWQSLGKYVDMAAEATKSGGFGL